MMRKYFIILCVLLFSSAAFCQRHDKSYLDSLYYTLLQSRGMLSQYNGSRTFSIDTNVVKCGTGLVNDILLNLNYFTSEQRKVLLNILSRPGSDTSFVTPNGFFRVHYYKSGTNAPGYSLTELAIALDSAYNFEVNYLGYPPPPGDSIANTPASNYGGDNLYDIYITNISEYGYTQPELDKPLSNNRYPTFIVIDNDFAENGFNTHGINAARVTVAHEFHHGIQIGNYIDRYDLDEFFYELTSTSMEHFVYPSIHDYYAYLPSYFNNTQVSFGQNHSLREYALAIWNIYLQEKFGRVSPMKGYNIIKRQWQLMPQMRALRAINSSLLEQHSSFGRELNNFGIWTYFTGYRIHPGQYFNEAADYPLIHSSFPEIVYTPPSKSVSISVNPLSNNFLKIYIPAVSDTLVSIITNANVNAGVDSANNFYTVTYNLYSDSVNGSMRLFNNYYENLTTSNASDYFNSEIFANQVIKEDTIINKLSNDVNLYAFPDPFYYSVYYRNGPKISFPVNIPPNRKVNINIYSIGMNLIYSGSIPVTLTEKSNFQTVNLVAWPVEDSKGRKLASGVYFYIIKYGDQTYKGKFVVFQ